MYNTTPNRVHRAHSFDSYDNLDRWQAMREHRMQFLSTRAKFDKVPPSQQPPTPPPRHSSKFKVKFLVPPPLSTSSPVNSLKQEFKREDTSSRENEIFSLLSLNKNKEDSYLPMNKDTLPATNKGDSSIANHFQINKSHNDDQNKFQVLKSPGNVLKLTQSWQKYTEDSEEINVLKPTPQSVLEPESAQENERSIEEVNEPVMVRKKVEGLRYQEPTFFKDVKIPSVSQCPNKFILSSNYPDPSIDYLNSFRIKKVQKAFIPSSEKQSPFLKSYTESSQSDFSYSRPNQLHLSNSSNGRISKNEVTLQMPLHETSWKPKNSTLINSSTYLESSFKMFTESLLEQGDSSFTYSNDLHVGRPRRISTGSMHEPTIWRSQSTTEPVKALVKKFS